MTKEELEKEIEKVKEHRFMIDMIDHWTAEDREAYDNLTKLIKELEEKLAKLNEN